MAILLPDASISHPDPSGPMLSSPTASPAPRTFSLHSGSPPSSPCGASLSCASTSRGSAPQGGEFANTNFSSNVEDLGRATTYLAEHHGPAEILIGHSLGGAAVLAAAG